MTIQRHNTEFSIRYAVRLHEREQSFWSVVAKSIYFLSTFGCAAAFILLIGRHYVGALLMGGVFALAQLVRPFVHSSLQKQKAIAKRKAFASLYAQSPNLSDDALHLAYLHLISTFDAPATFEAFRQLAYNDVAKEIGADESYFYPNTTGLFFARLC